MKSRVQVTRHPTYLPLLLHYDTTTCMGRPLQTLDDLQAFINLAMDASLWRSTVLNPVLAYYDSPSPHHPFADDLD